MRICIHPKAQTREKTNFEFNYIRSNQLPKTLRKGICLQSQDCHKNIYFKMEGIPNDIIGFL